MEYTRLYNFVGPIKKYWETWENTDGSFTIHWGKLGHVGETKIVKNSLFNKAVKSVSKAMTERRECGFAEFYDISVLLIEYEVDGFGTDEDLKKRHDLQDRMDEILGWTGLGHCDGGSVGSGTMEVCTFVVDADIAKSVISKDLKDTKFDDYSRIYVE